MTVLKPVWLLCMPPFFSPSFWAWWHLSFFRQVAVTMKCLLFLFGQFYVIERKMSWKLWLHCWNGGQMIPFTSSIFIVFSFPSSHYQLFWSGEVEGLLVIQRNFVFKAKLRTIKVFIIARSWSYKILTGQSSLLLPVDIFFVAYLCVPDFNKYRRLFNVNLPFNLFLKC